MVKVIILGQTLIDPKRLIWFSSVFSKFHNKTSKLANTKVVRCLWEHVSQLAVFQILSGRCSKTWSTLF
jgi:threonine/homoserine/homoserine lactone efflux protein